LGWHFSQSLLQVLLSKRPWLISRQPQNQQKPVKKKKFKENVGEKPEKASS
jgi:hypothetical protein